jgi:uncharacterized membrane protein YcaP (DUF421 family)
MEYLQLIEPENGELEWHHMVARGILAYIISFVFCRIAGPRTFGRLSFTDNITVLTLGAIIGRSIVTTQPFFPSMIAVLLIVLLHRLSTWISFKNSRFGEIVKGKSIILIKDGIVNTRNLKKVLITENDLHASLRLNGLKEDFTKVKAAYLERSGEISIVK